MTLPQSTYLRITLFLLLAAAQWGFLSAHGHGVPQDSRRGVQTVPPGGGFGGTVTLGNNSQITYDPLEISPSLDSLELRLLELEIKRQEENVAETSFWRRLIPRIHFSASFGMHDLMFIDPASFTPYILPRDAYRLTVSLSLNDVLISSAHTQAILELEKLRETLSIRRIQHARERRLFQQQLTASRIELESLEKELGIVQGLLRFNQLRFEQGKIEFDALASTKLELLSLQRSIQRVRHQQLEVQLKLGTQ